MINQRYYQVRESAYDKENTESQAVPQNTHTP